MADQPQRQRDSLLGPSAPLVPPLYQTAVYALPDLDALDQIIDAEQPGYTYARDGHPNAHLLAEQLARMEEGRWGVVCGSGMAAISAAVLSHVQQGDRIVASNRLYGRTTQFFGQELTRFGVQTAFVDTSDAHAVESALRGGKTKILFVETISNPHLRLTDIEAMAELAGEAGCLLAVDNTFATPVLVQPLKLGADLVIESLTKMIGGHSDVTLGFVGGTEADRLPMISQAVTVWGLSSNPFDCWLAARGLCTLSLRMKSASATAAALADWLEQQASVVRVIYPGRKEHPDHELAGRMLSGGFGNMLCFEIEGGRQGVNRFMRQAPGIPFSPSLGHSGTTCSHPWTTSHRYVSPAEKRRQGIDEGLIRLSVGVEELKQIQDELQKGLR